MRHFLRHWRNVWQLAVIVGMFVLAACGDDAKYPTIRIDHKTACELKSTAAVQAAALKGIACGQIKNQLALALELDPDCKAYFGDADVEVSCGD